MVSIEQRVTRIDAALPQTQCQQCGYPRCKEYAQAVAQGNSEINRCPPGGAATIEQLARLLNTPAVDLDPTLPAQRPPVVARIREHECIGCTLCIQACPTDAIVGAAKLMHTVIAEDCSGCELCLPVCPVDCIDTPAYPVPAPVADSQADNTDDENDLQVPAFLYYTAAQAAHYRRLTERRLKRLNHDTANGSPSSMASSELTDAERMREDIAAAVARQRARRRPKPQ